MNSGWYLLSFLSELKEGLNSKVLGRHRILLIKNSFNVSAYDAVCPHRGADLSISGVLKEDAVVCGFHGFKINLGIQDKEFFCVRQYATQVVDGMVFINFDQVGKDEFTKLTEKISLEYKVYEGFKLLVSAPYQLVIENAFDEKHFVPVHDLVKSSKFEISHTSHEIFQVYSKFTIPPSDWQTVAVAKTNITVPYTATAYSPGLVISNMGGENPYIVITGATPQRDGQTAIRLSIAVKTESNKQKSDVLYLLKQSRKGLEKDREIWMHLKPDNESSYVESDESILGFQKYCQKFVDYNLLSETT